MTSKTVLPVSKYHGCGNDFILIPEEAVASFSPDEKKDLIRAVCDRHTGIGADGLMFVTGRPFQMLYYNQDGSRADMCGNGIRCLAAYLYDHSALKNIDEFEVETLAGKRAIRIESKDPFMVSVDMGKPRFENSLIGVMEDEEVWDRPLQTDSGVFNIHSFYMNTIHTVVFTARDPFDPKYNVIGTEICLHPFFSMQTNVNFVQVLDEHTIKAATVERGCGPTLACGTGMCAAAYAAVEKGLVKSPVHVEMKKGALDIEIKEDGSVILTGPAKCILEGDYYYDKKTA